MTTPDPTEWFDAAPEGQRPILVGLRKLILSAAPGIVEEIKWGRPCYSTTNGMFCYLHYTKNYATLGFHKGTSLKDPKNLLEGTGKDMRHIKVADADAVKQPALLPLIKQAVKLA
jgi:hypothetical protein